MRKAQNIELAKVLSALPARIAAKRVGRNINILVI